MIDPATKIRRSTNAAWREIDGQVAVVSIDVNRVRLLNVVGSFVWTKCESATVGQLAEALADRYRIPAERALADVVAFVTDLRARGMIEIEGVA
jgi:hypothetical protein